MPSVLVTPAAESDLVDIWLYIARDNEDTANRVYLAAEKTFKTLMKSPGMGTLYRHKRAKLKGVRFFPVSNYKYIIYYQEHPEGITIIRVLHAHTRKHGDALKVKIETGVIESFQDITVRRKLDAEKAVLIDQLKSSLKKVKLLSGFLPICASCKKIRDDKGYHNQIEQYIREHSDTEFSHSICPECVKKLYPDLVDGNGNIRNSEI